MDFASRTIDRHEPIIPDYIQGEISLKREMLMTKIKNNFALRYCNVGQIKRWVKRYNPIVDPFQKVISRELLDRALEALLGGKLLPEHFNYLVGRGLSEADISRFGFVSTSSLVGQLSEADVTNLSLRISDKFTSVADKTINGVSVPYFLRGDLFGFCTRVIGCDLLKYSISIPQRFCFGLDAARSDYVVVVEGMFDAIPLISGGFHCMALGDSQPNYWKMLQASKFDTVYLLFDNDYSGKLGAAKSHVILNEMLGISADRLHLIVPDDGIDPIKYFLEHGPEGCLGSKCSLKALAANLTALGRNYAT